MRRFLTILCGLVLVVLCLGLFIFWQNSGREQSFPDGSVIRIEKVAFGNKEHINPGGSFGKLKTLLTRFVRSKFSHAGPNTFGGSSWYQNTVYHSNEPALYIYISRSQAGQGYRSVDAQIVQLIDEDGCVFRPTQSGGWEDGLLKTPARTGGGMRYSVGWFRFEAFPRHDKQFKFRLSDFDYSSSLSQPAAKAAFVEFSISNPAPKPKAAHWSAEPLPATQSQDNVSFILSKVDIRTNGFEDVRRMREPKSIVTEYKFSEDDRPSTNWQGLDADLYDASGNFVSGQFGFNECLCPRESAWKLNVKFFGSENSRAASNAVWTLHGLAVPGAGQFSLIDRSETLQGVLVKAVTFGGAGDLTYSNGIALAAASPDKPIDNNSSSVISWPSTWTGKNSVAKPTFSLHTKSPNLAIDVGDLSNDQRLTVRAVDDQGREFYGHKVNDRMHDKSQPVKYLGNWYDGEGGFLIFDLPADAKTVDLTFCVHTCRKAEFIFKPPELGASSAK